MGRIVKRSMSVPTEGTRAGLPASARRSVAEKGDVGPGRFPSPSPAGPDCLPDRGSSVWAGRVRVSMGRAWRPPEIIIAVPRGLTRVSEVP